MADKPTFHDLLKEMLNDHVGKSDMLAAVEQFKKYIDENHNTSKNELQQAARMLADGFAKLKEDLTATTTTTTTQATTNLDAKWAAIEAQIRERLAAIRDGEPGVNPDPADVVPLVLKSLVLPEQRAVVLDGPEEIRNKLELLQGDERLTADAIQGLPELSATVKEVAARPSGGYSPSGPTLMVGGTKKGRALNLNLKAGSNMTVSHSYNNGQHDITFTSTGGSGFTELSATETPNGSLKVFTFSSASAQPSYVVVDNVWMKATSKAGTVNWTYASGTKKVTLTIPANDDIFAIV